MIKLGKLLKEIMDAVPATPQQNVQPAVTSNLSPEFVNYIKFVENGQKVGFDRNKKLWFPHKSYEGGLPTIGYGHKVKDNNQLTAFKKGITDDAVTRLLTNDLAEANKKVHEYIKNKYKVNLTLTQRQNEMLTDFAFNLGSLEKFPKFVDALLRNNNEVVKKEYKRFSNGKELTGRNTAFYNRFLK